MPIQSLNAPGESAGPCRFDCGHGACEGMRRMAIKRCADCREQIGYGVQFYTMRGASLGMATSFRHIDCEAAKAAWEERACLSRA